MILDLHNPHRLQDAVPARWRRRPLMATFALLVSCASSCGSSPSARPGEHPANDAGQNATRIDSGTGGQIPTPMDSGIRAGRGPNDPDAGARSVSGTVVDFYTHRPLGGRQVSISGRVAITNSDGMFALSSSGPMYDVTVIDPDQSSVSVFKGLTIPTPVIPHHASTHASVSEMNTTTVQGSISGVSYAMDAGDSASVYFFGAPYAVHASLGFGVGPGAAYGPLSLSWAGAPQVDGEAVALVTVGGATAGPSWFAKQSTQITRDQPSSVDFSLTPVPNADVSGVVIVPPLYDLTQMAFIYRTSIPAAAIIIMNRAIYGSGAVSFNQTVPDLTSFGEKLCIGAGSTSPGTLWTELCAASPGQPATVTLHAGPILSKPAPNDVLNEGSAFAWNQFEGGIHALTLEPDIPTAADPSIYIFTAETSATWPNLRSEGLSSPLAATYHVWVQGLGPYATLDEATGPRGLSAAANPETWRSAPDPIDVTFTP